MIQWEDKRYMAENEFRRTECKSNYVVWTEENQFWLPIIDVKDDLELGSN